MIGGIFIFPLFMSISLGIKYVIHNFIGFVGYGDGDGYRDGDEIMFKIFFCAKGVVSDIQPFSAHLDKSEIQIAASTIFCENKVCESQVPHELNEFNMYRRIPKVHPSSSIFWHNFDFD
jgi:hypothetical protein